MTDDNRAAIRVAVLALLAAAALAGPARAQTRGASSEPTGPMEPAVVRASGSEWRALAVPGEPVRLQAAPQRDPVSNGVLIGAAIGAGVGFVSGLVDTGREPSHDCSGLFCGGNFGPSDGQVLALATAFGAGVGAAIGWLVDAAHDANPAPDAGVRTPSGLRVTPVLSPRRQGIVLLVRW